MRCRIVHGFKLKDEEAFTKKSFFLFHGDRYDH